jgi:carbon monoxide dehydrogenase subunit G
VALWGNLEGTMRALFSIGKGTAKVDLRTNAGVIQARNNGGAWQNILGQSAFADIETKGSTFTAAYNKTYVVTATMNIQLPAPVAGGVIEVKAIGSIVMTLVRNGSEKIDNVASSFVSSGSENEAFKIVTDGTDWYIL